MPARAPKLDYEPFYQYHNRLASFISWPLNWEMNRDKPTPETLARAGFFHHAQEPYASDNVICPFCRIFLDEWEPDDDPIREHRLRSPFCSFVRGRPPVRKMEDNDGTVRTTQSEPRSDETHSIPHMPPSDHNPHSDDSGQRKADKTRALEVANEKDLSWRETAYKEKNMKKRAKQPGD